MRIQSYLPVLLLIQCVCLAGRPSALQVMPTVAIGPLGVTPTSKLTGERGWWSRLWRTDDQLGAHYFANQQYAEAAALFRDPLWIGSAWYRAGEFERATQAFSRVDTPEARFNEANAWLFQGKYETAIQQYDKALEQRPEWQEAKQNRAIAVARWDTLHQGGGEAGDQRIGADKIVFDKDKDSGGQETELRAEQANSDSAVQAMWLRRVQTDPADFLRSKFAYQLALDESEGR